MKFAGNAKSDPGAVRDVLLRRNLSVHGGYGCRRTEEKLPVSVCDMKAIGCDNRVLSCFASLTAMQDAMRVPRMANLMKS